MNDVIAWWQFVVSCEEPIIFDRPAGRAGRSNDKNGAGQAQK